jgi:hypothetical protein
MECFPLLHRHPLPTENSCSSWAENISACPGRKPVHTQGSVSKVTLKGKIYLLQGTHLLPPLADGAIEAVVGVTPPDVQGQVTSLGLPGTLTNQDHSLLELVLPSGGQELVALPGLGRTRN